RRAGGTTPPAPPGGRGGPPRPPRPGRSPAEDEPQVGERLLTQPFDDRGPGRVELVRGGGRAAAGDAVRLLHERHSDLPGQRGLGDGDEIGGADAPARAVPQEQPPVPTPPPL